LLFCVRNSKVESEILIQKLVRLIAMYCSHVDSKCDLATLELTSSTSLKSNLAHLVLNDFVLKICDKPKYIWRQIYTMRPQWLAALVAGD
jgi:hypothetical protein